VPDPATACWFPSRERREHFLLGDLVTLEGLPWDYCPRQILRRAIERLKSETG